MDYGFRELWTQKANMEPGMEWGGSGYILPIEIGFSGP